MQTLKRFSIGKISWNLLHCFLGQPTLLAPEAGNQSRPEFGGGYGWLSFPQKNLTICDGCHAPPVLKWWQDCKYEDCARTYRLESDEDSPSASRTSALSICVAIVRLSGRRLQILAMPKGVNRKIR